VLRRTVLVGGAALLARPLAARAQPAAGKVARIGRLSPQSADVIE